MRRLDSGWLMLAPAFLIQAWLIAAGVFIAAEQSLGIIPTADLMEPTLRYYAEILKTPEFILALGFSLYCGLVSATAATLLGLVMSVSLRYYRKSFVIEIIKLPVIMPHLIVVLLVLFVCGKTGILARLAFAAGGIAEPTAFPDLVFDKWGLGIILTYTWKSAPFAALLFYTFMQKLDFRLYDVALNLGANKQQAVLYVLLPLLRPVMIMTFVLIFAYAFTAYETPKLIGPTFPKTLPVLAYDYYISADIEARPYSMAINTIMIMLSLLLLGLVGRAAGRRGYL